MRPSSARAAVVGTTWLVLADSPDHTRRHAIPAHIQHHKLRPVAPTVQLHHAATTKVHAHSIVPFITVLFHSKLATRRHLPIRPNTDHTHAARMCHAQTVP